jgi:predicted permease
MDEALVAMHQIARSLRLLIHQPRYTALAVLTLAAGIGVNAAVFGLLDAVYFRPLPLTDPDRLVDVRLERPDSRFTLLSYPEFRDIEQSVPAFVDVLAIGQRGVTLNVKGETELLGIHYVSGRYFQSLGIPLAFGRGLTVEDDRTDAVRPLVVINHSLWKERLGGPPDIIGRTIQLNNTMFTVIGVTAPGFVGLDRIVRTDVWVTVAEAPLVVPGLGDELTDRHHRWFEVIGRLATGAPAEQARGELDALLARWRAVDAQGYLGARLAARPERDATWRATLQGAVFLGLVGLVLLIACGNVANLTLARGESRRREMALRAALGASRVDLIGQLLVESAIVALVAATVGVLLASWLIQLVPALLPPGDTSLTVNVRFDGRLVAYTVLLTALATALVGLLPAWRGSHADIASDLKSLSPGTASVRGGLLRDALVVGEIALSGVLLIGAGLLVRSFAQSLAVNPGFDTGKDVATFYLVPELKGYRADATYRFFDACRRSAAGLPGVARVSYAIRLPAQGNEAGWAAEFTIPGKQPPPGHDAFHIRYTMVGSGYFEVMGTRILRGRGIDDQDRPDSAPVAVVSESMARQLWPGESPIGRRIRMGRGQQINREIVGVAEDIRIGGLYEAPEMYVYVPYAQDPQGFGLLLVETHGDSAGLVGPIRRSLAAVDPVVPVLEVSSFADHMNRLLYEERRNAQVAFAVALLALTLGAVGVHGVIALVTARRTREIGIRVALGAGRGDLLRLLLGRSVRLVAAGTMLGMAGGLAAGRLLESQLHGLAPSDPWSAVLGASVLVLVALGSSVGPVWRAARLDPAVALREE